MPTLSSNQMPVTRQQSKGKLKPMHGEPITDAKSEGGSTGDRPNYCGELLPIQITLVECAYKL